MELFFYPLRSELPLIHLTVASPYGFLFSKAPKYL